MTKEKSIHDVPVPYGVDERMVAVAKYYVSNRLTEGFTMESMFKHFGMTGRTYYQWLENQEYSNYINEMSDILIPESELVQVRKMKSKILAYADKTKLTTAELKIFMDTFGYLFEADARLQMEKLGLNQSATSSATSNNKTVEERKASLLSRLMKGNETE